jgi:excisionase family DNA binding protein
MMDKEQKSPLEGLVESEEAAKILGISLSRLYDYLREGRIPSERVGKSYIMRREDVERFKANPTGRKRTKPTSWHIYQGEVKVLETEILISVHAHQQERLAEKLQAIQNADQHTFPGTIARYIFQDNKQRNYLQILLIWKNTEMPYEEIRQQYLAAFQAELADVLDWEHAQIQNREALIHT